MLRKCALAIVTAVLLVLTLGLPQAAEAQGRERNVSGGVKAGFTYSSLRIVGTEEDIGFEFGSDAGFTVGGLAVFGMHPNLSVQPEGLYTRRKVQLKSTEVSGLDALIETAQFDIPVLLKVHAQQRPGVRPFALVGATFSFLLSAEQTAEFMGVTETEDIKDELVSTDVGLTFGGGLDFIQAWGAITIDVRYVLGLRDFVDVDSDSSGDDTNLRAGSFVFSGGVVF